MGKRIACFALCLLLFLTAVCLPGFGLTAAAKAEGVSVPVVWGAENDTGSLISFSHDSGTYPDRTLTVTLSTSPEYTIACTTDGTMPSADDDSGSSVLEVPVTGGHPGYLAAHRAQMVCTDFSRTGLLEDLRLPLGTVLTAALLDREGNLSDPVSKVYFPGLDFEELFPGCLVFSVTTDPENLLDYETGILVPGAVYDEWRQTDEGKHIIRMHIWWQAETNSTQRGRDWERPVRLHMYDSGRTPAVDCTAGIRVRGGVTRRMNQKSFNLYFRESYGAGSFEYELFPGISSYKSFSLKSGGNATESLKYKDVLLQSLVKGRDYTVLDARPAVLFLNGEYWGPYNLTEKISGQTFHNRYGVDKDQLVVIKGSDYAGIEVEEGVDEDIALYQDLMSFADRDLTDPDIYREFCSVMDISSMADYFATRIYIGDGDWTPTNNDVLWRSRDTSWNGGRWQYILYDTEYSSGLYGERSTAVTTDHFRAALEEFPLFAAALRNKEFYDLFLAAIKEIGAECFAPERVEQELRRFQAEWKPLMPDFYRRFGDSSQAERTEAERMLKFFRSRYDIIIPLVESWGEAVFQ